jgi:hypothetical protein
MLDLREVAGIRLCAVALGDCVEEFAENFVTFCGAKFGFCILVHDVYPPSVSKRRRARLNGLVLAEDPDLPLLEATRGHLMPHAAKGKDGDHAAKPRVDFHWWQRGIGYRSKDF